MRMANCTGQKKHIFALRCFCSAGKLIIALHCSFHLSFFLTPNLIPCGSLPRSLFLFKPISQAGLAGSEHNVLAQEKDNTDRKRRAQPPRWTGSWVHCLVSLIRRRRKRQRRGDMVRQTRRAKLRLRRRNWLSVYIYIYLNPNRKALRGLQAIVSMFIKRHSKQDWVLREQVQLRFLGLNSRLNKLKWNYFFLKRKKKHTTLCVCSVGWYYQQQLVLDSQMSQ